MFSKFLVFSIDISKVRKLLQSMILKVGLI